MIDDPAFLLDLVCALIVVGIIAYMVCAVKDGGI